MSRKTSKTNLAKTPKQKEITDFKREYMSTKTNLDKKKSEEKLRESVTACSDTYATAFHKLGSNSKLDK